LELPEFDVASVLTAVEDDVGELVLIVLVLELALALGEVVLAEGVGGSGLIADSFFQKSRLTLNR